MDEAAPQRTANGGNGQLKTARERAEARANIFVVASLYSDQGSAPVRIRNISAGGALIEGAVIPLAGSRVRLCRGSLSVAGEVVWCRESKAGLRFDASVSVADWFPAGKRQSGQQRADEIVYNYKFGPNDGWPSAAAAQPAPPVTLPQIAGTLFELNRALVAAASELAMDPAAAARNIAALQDIDRVAARLDELARQIPPAPGGAA